MGVLTKHITETPPPLSAELSVPPALEAVMMRALAKEPNARLADAAELSRELHATIWLTSTPADQQTSSAINQTQAGQQAEPAAARPAASPEQVVTNHVGIELVWIPPGSFMMGSTNDESEKPVHQVTIRKGFYMGKYEVTQAQWQQVMGTNPSNFKGDSLPVERVSWNDAQKFIGKLNEVDYGFVYRLPCEAEWEYAARAGTTTAFAFGDSLSSEQANFDGNYPYGGAAKGVYRVRTTPVGNFQPNAFGLFDMHGDVWEWCLDHWHESYAGAPSDGSGWLNGGDSNLRVLRGGSWNSYANFLRSANRDRYEPDRRFSLYGFRVVAVART